MKKADLEKFLAKKVEGAMRRELPSDRFGAGSAHVHDRREQRKLEQAAGLVPYAVKLPQALVSTLQSLAQSKAVSLNDLTADLLRKAIGEPREAIPAAAPPPKAASAPAPKAAPMPAPKAAPTPQSKAAPTPPPKAAPAPAPKAAPAPARKPSPAAASAPAPKAAPKPAAKPAAKKPGR